MKILHQPKYRFLVIIIRCFYSILIIKLLFFLADSDVHCMGSSRVEFINLSEEIVSAEIDGMIPNWTTLRARDEQLCRDCGKDEYLTKVGSSFNLPVTFDNVIEITWTVEGDAEKKKVKLNRKDLNIPAKVCGGVVKIIYTEKGNWKIEGFKEKFRYNGEIMEPHVQKIF